MVQRTHLCPYDFNCGTATDSAVHIQSTSASFWISLLYISVIIEHILICMSLLELGFLGTMMFKSYTSTYFTVYMYYDRSRL